MTSGRHTLRRTAAMLVAAVLTGGALTTTAYAATPPPKPLPAKILALQDQWGDAAVDHVALDSHGVNQPQLDPGSLLTVGNAIGARALWGQRDTNGKAVTGQGVTVAVLDSGVEAVPGLNAPGQVVQGPDLSLEANSSVDSGHDTFGHGTHLASIIAARDDRATDASGKPTGLTNANQMGIAPGAQVLAVKAATADGSTDVSEVIAGLDWIVAHRNDNGMNVKVINLSFGTDSTQSYLIDPLTAAVENAWRHGIVVVVSAGNDGNGSTQLTDPAMDPYVIAVGASDPNLQVSGWQSPLVASFSNSGNATRSPDLVAPGRSIVGLRDPGSFIDTEHPEGLVTGDSTAGVNGGRLFRGSGTSQAAAVVSGAVTLLAQAFPNATPDQLKAALKHSAKPVYGAPTTLQGAGELSVNDSYNYLKSLFPAKPTSAQLATLASMTQNFTRATGLGSLELARGGSHLVDPTTGIPLSGEVDVQGLPWNAAAWQAAEAADTAWTGGSWLGVQYTGSGWANTAAWTSASWSAARWSGAQWTDEDWSAHRWSAHRWSSALWTAARWSAHLWD